jgi:hypothetical protein
MDSVRLEIGKERKKSSAEFGWMMYECIMIDWEAQQTALFIFFLGRIHSFIHGSWSISHDSRRIAFSCFLANL